MKKVLSFLLIVSILTGTCLSEGVFGWLSKNIASRSLKYVSVAKSAFREENMRVIAADSEGNYVLICSAYDLYIWNVKRRQRVPLRFENEQDQELLDFYVMGSLVNTLFRNLQKEQKQEKQIELETRKDEYLKRQGLQHFSSLDQVTECFPNLVSLGAFCEGIGDCFALVVLNYMGFAMTLEFETGLCSIVYTESTRPAFCKDKLFADWLITDLATGGSSIPDLKPAIPEDGVEVSTFGKPAPVMLNDGSLAFLTYANRPEGGLDVDCYVSIAGPEEGRVYSLGIYQLGRLSQIEQTADSRYLLIIQSPATSGDALILDRQTGEVKVVDTRKYVPFAAYENLFLCYSLKDYCVMTIDPSSLDVQKVSLSGISSNSFPFSAFVTLKGNGKNAYFAQNWNLQGYFVMSER